MTHNHALQRTAPAVTLAAPPPSPAQPSRQPSPSLSLGSFIDTAPLEFPNFKRLRDTGASTFNARCDYSHSITIPDHLTMMTGRRSFRLHLTAN